MNPRKNTPADNKCAECGGAPLTLAIDCTMYRDIQSVEPLRVGPPRLEHTDSMDPCGSIRVFCAECGEYYVAPDQADKESLP